MKRINKRGALTVSRPPHLDPVEEEGHPDHYNTDEGGVVETDR